MNNTATNINRKTLSASSIIGDKVVNMDNQTLGEVKDLMLGLERGQIAYAVLELSVQDNRRAAVVIHDGREPQTNYHEQDIPWTDFPLEHVKLYIQQNEHERVVMLPSEY